MIRLSLFDLDGTLTQEPSAWEYIHRRLGLWTGYAERFQEAFQKGEIDYHRFCQLDAALWKGKAVEEILGILQEIPHHEGIEDLLTFLKSKGILAVIISSGLSFLAQWMKKRYGFDEAIANDLETLNGRLTGGIQIRVHHDRKGEWVAWACRRFHVFPKEVLAIGDSSGDIDMFLQTGYSIAFNPRCDRLASLATWSVRSGDLRTLIPLLKPLLESKPHPAK